MLSILFTQPIHHFFVYSFEVKLTGSKSSSKNWLSLISVSLWDLWWGSVKVIPFKSFALCSLNPTNVNDQEFMKTDS